MVRIKNYVPRSRQMSCNNIVTNVVTAGPCLLLFQRRSSGCLVSDCEKLPERCDLRNQEAGIAAALRWNVSRGGRQYGCADLAAVRE